MTFLLPLLASISFLPSSTYDDGRLGGSSFSKCATGMSKSAPTQALAERRGMAMDYGS